MGGMYYYEMDYVQYFITNIKTQLEKPFGSPWSWDFAWEEEESSLPVPQSLQGLEDLCEHQWSGTLKKYVVMNFLNLFLYSRGEIIVGNWFLGTTREALTQVSSCLSQVYCLR